LLTFDIPGFEWDTDLDMYRHILRQREFDFIEVEVAEEQRVTSRNGPVAYAGWESLGRLELECYRLLAWHIGVSENRFSNEVNSSLQNPGESTVEVFPYTLAADGQCGEGSV